MSEAETIKHFRLTIGDGAEPTEAFSAPCLLASRGLQRAKNLRDDTVFPCPPADPYTAITAGAWDIRTEVSKNGTISGSGLLSKDDHATWEAWFNTHNDVRNVRIYLVSRDDDGTPGAATVRGYYEGGFQLASYDLTQETEDALVAISITLQSSGEITWTADPVTT